MLNRLLNASHTRYIVIALAVLLVSPSLFGGLGADDWFHRAHFEPTVELLPKGRGPILDLFAFFPSDPIEVNRLIQAGILPWWTQAGITGAFFRPITALTHAFDWLIIGDIPLLHHLHSLLWFAAALLAASAFFEEWLKSRQEAVLATLLFALDESHAMPVAWIANRNSLLAAAFGALAARSHLKGQYFRVAWFLALALGSAEAGTATLLLLLSLELGIQDSLYQRIRRWLPACMVVLIWAGLWKSLGYGISGSGFYIDPLRAPLSFLKHLPERLGALLSAAWLNAPVDGWVILPESFAWWIGLGLLGISLGLIYGLVGKAQSVVLRQGIWISILCLLPPCGVFPMIRVVGMAGLGVAGALATLYFLRSSTSIKAALFWHLPVAGLLLGLNGIAAPYIVESVTRLEGLVPEIPDLNEKVLMITGGHEASTAYIPIVRSFSGKNNPKGMLVIGPVGTPLSLTREDTHTLKVEAQKPAFTHGLERLCREAPFKKGEQVYFELGSVEVLEVDAKGRLLSWRVRLKLSLDDPSLIWRKPDGLRYLPMAPPAPGQTILVPAAISLPG